MDTYRIDRSYDWNYEHGPSLDAPPPELPQTPSKTFLGYPVNARIGIAAGLLLNSRWIEPYSRWGFDILTYKTVRIKRRDCHPMPNWIFVETDGALDPARGDEVLVRRRHRHEDHREVTSSVSFGMPSKDPAVWCPDVERARRALAPGQVLIVSVVASPEPGHGQDDMVREFAALARLAAGAGAQVVEANLSCPNVRSAEGSIYLDPETSARVGRAMREAAGALPLTLKVGHFPGSSLLKTFLTAVAPWVDGVVLVNGISRRVVDTDGSPAFGPGREVAGILGRGIHEPCLATIREARSFIAGQGLDLEAIAVGGVLAPEDAAGYFQAGAHAVLMGGGPMFDPFLAVKMKRAHPEW